MISGMPQDESHAVEGVVRISSILLVSREIVPGRWVS